MWHKGNEKVFQELNRILADEPTAFNQYFVHSRLYCDWGFSKRYERTHPEAEEEVEHANAVIKRILFLEGTPDLEARHPD